MVKEFIVILAIGFIIGIAVGTVASIHQPHRIAALETIKKMERQASDRNEGDPHRKVLQHIKRTNMQTKQDVLTGESAR